MNRAGRVGGGRVTRRLCPARTGRWNDPGLVPRRGRSIADGRDVDGPAGGGEVGIVQVGLATRRPSCRPASCTAIHVHQSLPVLQQVTCSQGRGGQRLLTGLNGRRVGRSSVQPATSPSNRPASGRRRSRPRPDSQGCGLKLNRPCHTCAGPGTRRWGWVELDLDPGLAASLCTFAARCPGRRRRGQGRVQQLDRLVANA